MGLIGLIDAIVVNADTWPNDAGFQSNVVLAAVDEPNDALAYVLKTNLLTPTNDVISKGHRGD